jgi:3-methyladenine DNA glycosylase AlkD
MRKYLKEVESKVKKLPRAKRPEKWAAKNYVGGGQSSLHFLDITAPVSWASFQKGFSFSHLPVKEQWKIWDYIWKNSKMYDVLTHSLTWVSTRQNLDLHEYENLLLTWVEKIDNWAHSDEMSDFYSQMLEKNSKRFLPIFKKWSQSKKPWLRRQSVVGLLFYSRKRKKYLPVKTILSFIDKQIDDDHFYVQKGVGWALRESWNVYPKETFAYLKKNAHKIPAAGWTAATEKLSSSQKKILMAKRKANR